VAKIDELIFGSIVVEGRKYHRDVLIFADGTVKRRKTGAKGKNLSLLVQPSYDAVARLNELAEQKKKVAVLTHITC
jgi:hypothetical protein